jgi:hypothetical protein
MSGFSLLALRLPISIALKTILMIESYLSQSSLKRTINSSPFCSADLLALVIARSDKMLCYRALWRTFPLSESNSGEDEYRFDNSGGLSLLI